MQHEQALVGLGANLGDAAATLRAALLELDALQGCSLLRVSGLWRSAPVDAGGPDYCNAVAELRCEHGAEELLRRMQHIESRHGRVRPQGVRNAPRTLDLDLLCFGELRLQLDRLTLPHPRMHERAFVLVPLAELAPECRIPGRAALSELLALCRDQGVVRLEP